MTPQSAFSLLHRFSASVLAGVENIDHSYSARQEIKAALAAVGYLPHRGQAAAIVVPWDKTEHVANICLAASAWLERSLGWDEHLGYAVEALEGWEPETASDPSECLRERRAMNRPLTLGELIACLSLCPENLSVTFDFGRLVPTELDSYRGYYDHLALGFAEESRISCGELLARLNAAVGTTFGGWKGGEYTMYEDTPVWAANPGRSTDTAIVDVVKQHGRVVLVTALLD
jgi:hypothetical protein